MCFIAFKFNSNNTKSIGKGFPQTLRPRSCLERHYWISPVFIYLNFTSTVKIRATLWCPVIDQPSGQLSLNSESLSFVLHFPLLFITTFVLWMNSISSFYQLHWSWDLPVPKLPSPRLLRSVSCHGGSHWWNLRGLMSNHWLLKTSLHERAVVYNFKNIDSSESIKPTSIPSKCKV